jgi:hypothetical protein
VRLSKKLEEFRTDRPSEWIMDEFARQAKKMEVALVEVRELLAAQENKECLGVGHPDNEDCAPWPIVDEVINSITVALTDT